MSCTLTRRELDVLRLMAQGKRNYEIANSLKNAVGTVEGHVRHIFDKLGAKTRTEAVYIAMKRGIVNVTKEETNV